MSRSLRAEIGGSGPDASTSSFPFNLFQQGTRFPGQTFNLPGVSSHLRQTERPARVADARECVTFPRISLVTNTSRSAARSVKARQIS